MEKLSPEEQQLVRDIRKGIILPYAIVVWSCVALMMISLVVFPFEMCMVFICLFFFMNVVCAWVSYKYCPNMKSFKTSIDAIQDKLSNLYVDPAIEQPQRNTSMNATPTPRKASDIVGNLPANVYTVFIIFHIVEALFYLICVVCLLSYISIKMSSNA